MPPPDLWFGTSGPPDASIVLVGESWGSEEANALRPFVGPSGAELDRILAAAGVRRDSILCTNVVASKPIGNETWRFFTPATAWGKQPRIGGLAPSPLVHSEVTRLYRQIAAYPRRLVIAAGNFALWATSSVTGAKKFGRSNNRLIPLDQQTWVPSGIGNWRGSMWYVEPHKEFGVTIPPTKLLPIYHPAAIMREWYLREPTIHDLKVRVPMALADDWRPTYEILPVPTYDEALAWLHDLILRLDNRSVWLAADIETIQRNFLVCLGIADSAIRAISIPFLDVKDGALVSYWSPDHEAHIIQLLIRILSHPNLRLIGQNFIYDTQYIQRDWGITPHLTHDTMLAQNVLFPGVPKDLGYLSSMYCRYHWYWKEDAKEWDMKDDLARLLYYNATDCIRTWECAESQCLLLDHLDMNAQMSEKMSINGLCLRMMNRGVMIDRQHQGHLQFDMTEALIELHRELLTIVPEELIGPPGIRAHDKTPVYWFTSDKKTKELFYDIFGFKIVRDLKSGQPSTGKKALMQFKMWYPEFSGLINRLDTAGSVDNILSVLRGPIESDGRMRCSYNPGGTETHRLSSSTNAFGRGMNLQNLTKGEEDE